ncbi:hypothetical protein [Pseudonocardia xishanensis]|uniref:Anti-sigma-D factor RsdA-like protein n=1 Tax=Pseudonocardia xishanensis TaxID=630995 RepID=A0ABP8RD75_9PSEU
MERPPLDLSAVLADDALLDALGRDTDAEILARHSGDPLVEALLEWRSTGVPPVVRRPCPRGRLPAVAPPAPSAGAERRRPRLPVAGAVASLVACLVGVGLVVGPPDAGRPARSSVEAARVVDERLALAAAELATGDRLTARTQLELAEQVLRTVRPEDGRAVLEARRSALERATKDDPPAAPPRPAAHREGGGRSSAPPVAPEPGPAVRNTGAAETVQRTPHRAPEPTADRHVEDRPADHRADDRLTDHPADRHTETQRVQPQRVEPQRAEARHPDAQQADAQYPDAQYNDVHRDARRGDAERGDAPSHAQHGDAQGSGAQAVGSRRAEDRRAEDRTDDRSTDDHRSDDHRSDDHRSDDHRSGGKHANDPTDAARPADRDPGPAADPAPTHSTPPTDPTPVGRPRSRPAARHDDTPSEQRQRSAEHPDRTQDGIGPFEWGRTEAATPDRSAGLYGRNPEMGHTSTVEPGSGVPGTAPHQGGVDHE